MHYEDSVKFVNVSEVNVVVDEKAITGIAQDTIGTKQNVSYRVRALVDKNNAEKMTFYMGFTDNVTKVSLAELIISQPVGVPFVEVAYNNMGLQVHCKLEKPAL